jgi:hypothetical protein
MKIDILNCSNYCSLLGSLYNKLRNRRDLSSEGFGVLHSELLR